MKKNIFGIFLVIASPGEAYNRLKKTLLYFMNSNKNFITFFIYGNINKDKIYKSEYDLYFPKIKENFVPGITLKTIEAIKFINKNYDYKFVIRTNLSTFWRLDKLYKLLKKLEKNKYLAGGQLRKSYETTTKFIEGTGMVFSKKICDYLCSVNIKKYLFKKADDVLISNIIKEKFKIYRIIKRYEKFTNKNVIINKKFTNIPINYFCYRMKSNKNRLNDSKNMFKLIKFFYKKKK